MPKYMAQFSYSVDGVKGLLKEGGSKRRAVVEQLVEGLGGRLEAFYFALGETDVYAIVDLPNNVSSAAVSLAVSAGGAGHVKTIVLITPEEMDQATKTTVAYRPPGQ